MRSPSKGENPRRSPFVKGTRVHRSNESIRQRRYDQVVRISSFWLRSIEVIVPLVYEQTSTGNHVMEFSAILWKIGLLLFVGALGLPIPENPILLGGGYAIYANLCPAIASLLLWYFMILSGDILLFALSLWSFRHPRIAGFLERRIGERRLRRYREAFASRGAVTMFLARFTFGIRAIAYVAAGAARYPWKRFVLFDGFSIAVQVLLFVGIGYCAGEHLEWARGATHRLIVVLGVLALITLAIAWLSAVLTKRVSAGKKSVAGPVQIRHRRSGGGHRRISNRPRTREKVRI
jgi:membrane protein DedA with SNARE-associated domain